MTARDPLKVAVFCKPFADAREVLARIAETLRQRGAETFWDEDAAGILALPGGQPRSLAARKASLVISVGGDGTLLAAARGIGPAETPILGVNLGSLGFLTETRCEEVAESIGAFFDGRALIDRRSVLSVAHDSLPAQPQSLALNDVVFSKNDMARLFSLSLFVGDEWVADYRADGLIVATPTGSTAYSLAAGGPLIVPAADVLVITPISPHSLSQRPLIVPGGARLTVRLAEHQRSANVQVTLDGQVGFPLEPGEAVHVARAPHGVHLVRPPARTFFSTLRNKLGWARN